MNKYDTKNFRGIFVALNACYNTEDGIDKENVKKLVNWYVDKGVKGLYVCGSTGEGCLLNVEERKAMAEAACEAGKGKVVIIIHVGATATRDSVELAKHAEKCGADATSAVPNIFYNHSEAAIENHWNEIVKSTSLPFFIYNIPQLTGYTLSDRLLHKLSQNPQVVGVKNSSEISFQIMSYKALGGEDFIVFNGPDEQYLAGRVMGADGGIGGTYGPMPELYLMLEEFIVNENMKNAQMLQNEILALIKRLCSFPSMYGANKAVIKIRTGIDPGQPRLPFLPVDPTSPDIIRLAEDIENTISKYKTLSK